MSQHQPNHFIFEMVIGPLYEGWVFDPDTVNQQFERDVNGDYRSGWRIYDSRIRREITNPFRIKMDRGDTLLFNVASRDKALIIDGANVVFADINGPQTPFLDGSNPWASLPATTDRSHVVDYWQWDWPQSERLQIVADDGIWDVAATVTIRARGNKYRFSFDPRMCVGAGCI